MPSPRTLKKNDIVSVLVAGAIFIMPVEGYFDRNRSILHLRTPSGFLIIVAVHQIIAIHGSDRNIIHLISRENPPLCLNKSQSSVSL